MRVAYTATKALIELWAASPALLSGSCCWCAQFPTEIRSSHTNEAKISRRVRTRKENDGVHVWCWFTARRTRWFWPESSSNYYSLISCRSTVQKSIKVRDLICIQKSPKQSLERLSPSLSHTQFMAALSLFFRFDAASIVLIFKKFSENSRECCTRWVRSTQKAV